MKQKRKHLSYAKWGYIFIIPFFVTFFIFSFIYIIVFLIPFVLLLPPMIGVLGVQAAQPVADLISFAISIPLQCSLLREMRREEATFSIGRERENS